MGYEIELKYRGTDDKGTILFKGSKIEVENVELLNFKEGQALITILKELTTWMNKNIVERIEVKEN